MAESSNWTPLHARLHQTLHRAICWAQPAITRCRIRGQDSLCLIKLLLDLQQSGDGIAPAIIVGVPANAKHVEQLAKT